MITQKQALAWAKGGWKKSKYAKVRASGFGIDTDNMYGLQCKDFVNGYAIFCGFPFTAGDAITLWTVKQKGWQLEEKPRIGDVHVMPFTSGGITYGHTGVVVKVVPGAFYSIDQNWYNSSLTVGSPPRQVYHKNSEALGFLRCKFKRTNMITETGLNLLYRTYLGKDPSKADKKKYIGKISFDQAAKKIRGGPTYEARIKAAKAGKLNVKNHLPNKLSNAYVAPSTPTPTVTVLDKGFYEVK